MRLLFKRGAKKHKWEITVDSSRVYLPLNNDQHFCDFFDMKFGEQSEVLRDKNKLFRRISGLLKDKKKSEHCLIAKKF